MPRARLAPLFLAASALVAACAPAARVPPQHPAAEKPIVLETADDPLALTAVGAHFAAKGWAAEHETALAQLVLTSPARKKYGVRAYMNGKGEIDRLVLFKGFVIKPEARGSAKLRELVAELTNDVNGVVYQLSTDGALVCATWVYFIDALDPRLLQRALELLDEVAITVVAKKAPALIDMLQ
ncbi:MAG TPA: hypothetical protein VGQ83_00960 [Polyangia bacterium]|jgi:hypothetical protein